MRPAIARVLSMRGRLVVSNAIKPRTEGAFSAKIFQLAIDAHECFLRDILRLFFVIGSEHRQCQTKHTIFVTVDQYSEYCLITACQVFLNEVEIFHSNLSAREHVPCASGVRTF